MANGERSPVLEDLLRYQYAPVAKKSEEEPDSPQMKGCLENLARDMDIKNTIYSNYHDAAMASAEGRKLVANTYTSKWSETYGKATVQELFDYYSDAKDFKLSQYFSEGDLKVIWAKLSVFKDKKMKEIDDELKGVTEILKNARKEGDHASEEDIRNANSLKLMYEEAKKILTTFEAMKIDTFTLAGTQVGLKQSLKSVAGSLMKSLTE
ncbi:MAG TPA: hypothetical protein VMC80_03645 [Patescibacteria group bacterium]|nr:hypothetical protein [Patescibacteria group bacterium]